MKALLIIINDAPYGTEKGNCFRSKRFEEIVLVEKAQISSMAELKNEIMNSDKVLTF